jgi:hypothetical protein
MAKDTQEQVSEIITRLTSSGSKPVDQLKAAKDLASLVAADRQLLVSPFTHLTSRYPARLLRTLHPPSITMVRFKHAKVFFVLTQLSGALIAFTQLAVISGKPSEPFLIPLLPLILDKMADKVVVVKKQAVTCGLAIISLISPLSVPLVLPVLFAAMDGAGKWQTQQGACVLLKSLVPRCTAQIHTLLPEIVPKISECIWNIRQEVNQSANETMLQLCKVVGNPDVESVS